MRKLILLFSFSIAIVLFALNEGEFWDWATDAMTWTFTTGNSTDCTGGWEDGVGNPADSVFARCYGRNKDDTGSQHVEWTGTWEDLGVPSGDTVETVQMVNLDTRCFAYLQVDACEFGPFELRSSTNELIATLWSGRSPSGVEGSWTAEGLKSAQSVGALSASNASIELWMHGHVDLGNNASAQCKINFDNLEINILHSAPGAGGTDGGGCPDSPSGYGYCYPLTMESDNVSGSANLENYIVRFHKTYAWLATTANGGVVQQDDGDDIIFYQSGTQLKHQRYSYNPTTGEYGALIKIPVLDYNDDGLIYVYLGNASASDTSTTDVYDANYVGLYHLEEARSTDAGNYKDSVGTNHGTLTDANSNTVQDTGKFGKAINWSGDNADIINAGSCGTVMNGATITIIAWLNADDYGSTFPRIINRVGTPRQFSASINSSNQAGFTLDTVDVDFDTNITSAIPAMEFRWVVWRYDASTITIFDNGGIDGTNTVPEGVLANSTGIIQIGNRDDLVRPWDGIQDEIEYHNTHRSDDWLYTRYNVDNDQAGFWTAGAQDTVGGGPPVRRYAPVVME